MHHLPALINDLALILISAAIMTVIFKKLKQPIILGYLVAGYIVGPFFPTQNFMASVPESLQGILSAIFYVKDQESIRTWSEIGVIFMLFGLGLEFSFKKLVKVGKTASITASFEIGFMIVVGFLVGQMLGWSKMDSIFLGAILSMSSTTIIVKAFDELKLKGRTFAGIVFGALIVEDLIAILLMVILSSIAITHTFSVESVLGTTLRLVFFLLLWFLMGIFLLPLILRKCRDVLSDEILLIVSVGLCMLMVVIATQVGFSAELGAFVMGSILGETTKGNKIEHLTLPVKDLFSAVFFVSVGMRINPAILADYFGVILLVTVVTIVGKFFGTALGAMFSGCGVRNSTRAGTSMAQVGEFSFIIAMLGETLKVTGPQLYPIVVAVSAVTTFTTPYLIMSGDAVSKWIDGIIPERVHLSLLRYEVAMTEPGRMNVLSLLWKAHGLKILLNSILVLAIAPAVRYAVAPFLGEKIFTQAPTLASLTPCLVAVLLSAPFIWAVFRSKPPQAGTYDADTIAQLQRLQFGIAILRFLIGFLLVGYMVGHFVSIHAISGILLTTVLVVPLFLFSSFFEPLYSGIERRFISNLTAKERAAIEEREKLSGLAPWDVTLTEFELTQNSPLIGKTLQQSALKRDYGVTVAMILRGERRMIPPRGDDQLLPFDKIYLIGTDEQLTAVQPVIEQPGTGDAEFDAGDFGLVSFMLSEDHPLAGKTILDSGVRESFGGLIVGIERDGQRFLNPSSDMAMHAGDIVWMVGDKSRIRDMHQPQQESI